MATQANPFDQFDTAPAPVRGGPVYGAPPKVSDREPKTTYRTMTAEEIKARGLPADKSYQISSEGKIDALPTSDTKATVDQQKIATLTTRIAGGFRDMQSVIGKDPTAEEPGVFESIRGGLSPEGIGGIVSRKIAGPNRRSVYDAQVDVLDGLLTLGTGAAYSKEQLFGQTTSYFPQMGDSADERALKRQRLMRLIEAAKANAGPAWDKVEPVIAPYMNGVDQPAEKRGDQTPPMIGGTNGAPPPPAFEPGAPPMEPASGDTRRVENPQLSAQLDDMIKKGASLAEINGFLSQNGASLISESDWQKVDDFRKANPGYEGSYARAWKLEPLSGWEKAVTSVGANPIGAYFLGAGQFLSGNTLDNMAPDPEKARAAIDLTRSQNPTATAIGEVSGGVMGAMAGEAGLARAGMAPGIARGTIADMAMGAANGAGGADDGSRVTGAIKGAALAGAGSIAGGAFVKGVGRAIAPTGGSLSELYAAGVRPTIGQRAASSGGVVGRAINATEEGLQSVPIVGAAIRGARQEARDQFQVGAFNEALKEVGESLPAGMKPGTDPHAYAQRVFNDAYDTARAGMTVVPDDQLATDLAALSPDIATLGPAAKRKLKSIMENVVNSKVVDGQISGANYKKIVSDLGKRVGHFSKGQNSDDQALAEILGGIGTAIDSAARRHSAPEAVALLDAADAGYSKLVRIEGAAARRGGDAGTFSPAQFDAEVQKASGGVRSKAYLRGDAQMQDFARAGRALEDTMPNSGTPERLAVGAGVAGLGAIEPSTLGILGAIGAAYAPGVRRVQKAALAPRGAAATAIRQRLEKINRIAAASAASTAVVRGQGTSPSQ